MAGEFKLISTDQLFAKIEDQLNSYVANGILDVGRFYNEVKWFIQKLGIGAYDFDDAIIRVEDHKGEMPCDFHMLDSAWLCDHSQEMTYPIMQDKFVLYNKIECETISQNTSCSTSPVQPLINNGVIIQSTPCNNNNEQVLDKVTITEYFQGQSNVVAKFQTPILMTLRNRKSVNSVCEKDCKNLFARSPYEFQILQQGDSYVFTSTLKKAIVLVRYYKYPMDENGLPLIPDNPVIQKALEFHLMHYFFYMAWLNSDDVNIERKIQDLEIKRNNFLVEAMNYTKMQSFQQAVQMARKVRKRFGAYEEINSKHI